MHVEPRDDDARRAVRPAVGVVGHIRAAEAERARDGLGHAAMGEAHRAPLRLVDRRRAHEQLAPVLIRAPLRHAVAMRA
eukprot:6481664-Prymnesium_polylepis.1